MKSNTIPIGKPIANTQIYILDVHLNPVPQGVTGELYVGGIGVGRGYLNRPQLTSERFIANPFSTNPEEKLYKTGDLGRHLPDGNIEFLGRIDNQVKVRGFRIELGEIEAALNSHPQVTQTVVTTTEERPGNKRLVAYVVIEQSLTNKQLRDYLKTQIPEYMVPSTFVTLDALPLTPNGKIDRKALPAPNFEERENPYIEPRTEIEKTLVEIWCQLLLIDKIGINDNFFEIGGDSILSIQVVSRAKNAGIQISAKQIFQHQTIAELARVAGSVTAIECNQGTVTGNAPLTPIQEWFLAENKVEAHHYNQSVLLEIPSNTKPELIEKALVKLINHHDALRLRFPSLSEHQQINYGSVTAPLNIIDLSSTPQQELPQQIESKAKELQGSLNLSTGAIIQAALFNLGENQNGRLLIIIHHLVVDGVSWRILLSDLQTIYQQLINQEPVKLEAKTTAFIDWAQKLNEYANSEAIQTELEYWCNQPWNEITPLPLDYPSQKQSNTIDTAVNYSVKLNQSETKALLGKVNEAYNTQINDILLSALAISCSNWTGNSTIAIDLEGHGREELFDDVDLSRTVGWFTSLFPVLLQVPSLHQNKISDVIKSIKEQLRAIPNRGVGYGILRYLREPSQQTEQLQTTPTPEICFNYLGQFDQVQSESDWKFGTESVGDDESPKQNCEYLLEINSLVVEGCLQLNWTYSSKVHNSETVENLAQNYIEALKSIIEHCQLPSSCAYTPSDFPDAGLNQLELDELLTTIKTTNQTNLKNIGSIYPLSPTQQGMLFHSFYAPESGMYFELNEGEGFERVNYPLTLTVVASQRLSMNIGYDTDCFDGDTVERMLAHLQTILCSIADNPQQQLSQLPLLSQKERRQLLSEWNDTVVDYPTDKCVHQLFEQQVEKTPDAVAVSFAGEELTYKQLNQKANQLAHHLQSLGVEKEVLVGICLQRSIDMVVSVLAVLKAGAAYVPLDPNYPQERLNYILDDAAVEILITKTSLTERLATNQTKLVLLDDNQFSSTATPCNPVNTTKPNNLAYVIYTSGSTGKPKATMIEHRGCVNHCYAMIDTLELKATDTIAQTAPIGFDISVWQILTMLLVGGKVSVIKNEIIQDPTRFFESIEAEEITVVQVVPSLLATMLDICEHWGAKKLSHLRWLSVTGEAFNANLMHWWFKYYPSIPLLNAYGPAECSDDVTLYPIRYGENTELLTSNTIPIGKPIANTQIYILDALLNPVPIGVPGELYVGGIGVGRGYLNRPQLTSERFIANPFSSNPEERLYKTGDLGCYLPDGNIEFLGRIDNQVKVRGFRIELGEVEAAINTHPLVNQAVVTTTEEGSGNKRLVAYVVTEQSLTNKELRDYLKTQIPEYMVPSAFVSLDKLPLTPNGKVDRKALQKMDVDTIERENQYVPPRTAIELELTQIWSSVIGINPIGVKDNFFDLGGHSLLAVRLISEIQTHFQVNLPLATLFQTPTIEELAVTIDSASSENLWSSLVPIQPKGSLPPLFFVGGEGGNVLCFQGLAQHLENQPFYGLEPPGLDGVTKPLGSIEEIASHYITTIKSIQPVGPYYLGGHSFGGTVAFEMAQQLQNQGEEIAYVAILDSDPPTTEVNHKDDKLNRNDDSRWINELVPIIEELFETNLQISDATLASIPPEQKLNYFKQQLEMVGILPPQSDIKLVRGLIQVYKTQSQIEIDYIPQNTKPTPIALFCAQEADSGEEDYNRLLESQNAALSWNRLSQREVETHTVPGNHISILNEPHVKTLAQTLQKSLEQTRISLGEEPFQINSK